MKDLTPPGASSVSSRLNGTWPFFFFVANFVLMPIFFKLASEEMNPLRPRDRFQLPNFALNLNHRPLIVQFVMEPGFGLIGVPRACPRAIESIHAHACMHLAYSIDIATPYACTCASIAFAGSC
jgi:hypothetical protein